jgi:hypothetical protein
VKPDIALVHKTVENLIEVWRNKMVKNSERKISEREIHVIAMLGLCLVLIGTVLLVPGLLFSSFYSWAYLGLGWLTAGGLLGTILIAFSPEHFLSSAQNAERFEAVPPVPLSSDTA